MAMSREELEALRESGEERVFTARWLRLGRPYSEGCRGVVETVGAPADRNVVIIRGASGERHRWDMRHLSVY